MDAQRDPDGARDLGDDRFHAPGQGAAVGIAQHDPLGSAPFGGMEGRERVRRIELEAVEEMLRVVDDPAPARDQPAHALLDHQEVLPLRRPEHVGDVKRGALSEDRAHAGAGVGQRTKTRVVPGRHVHATGRPERDELGVLPLDVSRAREHLGVLRVRSGPPHFDVRDAESVEARRDGELVGDAEREPFALRPVAESRVVDLDSRVTLVRLHGPR